MAKIVNNENLQYVIRKEKERTENAYAKKTEVGALTSLTTTAKNDIVSAINEVNAKPSTGSYTTLTNKPQIESHELVAGNNTAASLGLAKADEVEKTKERINQKVQIVTTVPTTTTLPDGCIAVRVAP